MSFWKIKNSAFSQCSKRERRIYMYEITVMTDEEFEHHHRQLRKDAFLHELRQLSRPSTKGKSFSVKDVAKAEPAPKSKDSELHIMQNPGIEDQENWDDFVISLKDRTFSPIDEAIDDSFSDFKIDLRDQSEETDDFSGVFKKETAMMSEVLRDIKSIAKEVGKDITRLTKAKKGSGVTKSYSDLVAAYNGLIHNEYQLIKGIADFKTKQTDWTIKARDKKQAATNSQEQDVDSLVNQYYSKVMSGNLRTYNSNAVANYQYDPNFEYTEIEEPAEQPIQTSDDIQDTSGIDAIATSTGFNITQPLVGARNQTDYYQQIAGDAHGHIAHEQLNVEICVFKYGETYEFVAIGEDGEPVDGVELPSDINPGIVASLQSRPGSDYVYDEFGRKYRMFDKSNVDISDIDDMEYPFDSDDDR